MPRATWATRTASVIAVVAIALAACSSPGSQRSDSERSSSNPVAEGGDVRFHLYQAPTGFNPFHATNGADEAIAGLHFRPLISNEGEKYAPSLAKEWTVSADATTYTFTLQETNWSDGTPFTADDVLFSFESYVDPTTNSQFGGRLAPVKGYQEFIDGADTISGLTAPDEHTIVITLAESNAAFLNNLRNLYIVPKHTYSKIDRSGFQGAPEFREPEVGIGPYIFSRWVTDDQIEFVPNDESFESHPLDHIYAQYLDGDVARAQLETGEIDIAQIASPDVASVEASGNVNVSRRTGSSVMSLYTALDSGKLADVRVRQAILYAIDRESIVENVVAGNGSVAQSMLYQPSWVIPDDLIQYDYNPDKAKELLAEADWDADTEVNLDIVPGQADRDAVMDIIAGQLKEVGINATLRPLQPAELSNLVEDREFDLLITILNIPPAEPAEINNRFICDAANNISGYCNEELDSLLQQAISTSDQAKRAELYQEANRILNRDQPALPLYVVNQAWGSTKRVNGFDPNKGGLGTAQDWSITE